jgi:hypothetical protein
MSIIVEDGTGLENANSYASVEGATIYFEERKNNSWPIDNIARGAALIKATDYIDARFGNQFIGFPKTNKQSLQWPRIKTNRFGESEIPLILKRACFEYAVRAANGPLIPDIELTNGVAVFANRKKVGPLEKSFSAVQRGFGSSIEMFPPWPMADLLMRDLLIYMRQGEVIR